MSDDKPVFDEYGTLPGNLQTPAKLVMKYTGWFLDVKTQVFNWAAYKDAIDNRPDVDLVIEQYDSNKIVQQDNTVDIMVNKIGDLIAKVAGGVFDKGAMTERVKNAFTSLETQENNGFASWSSESSGNNTAFTYRILFAVPNAHVPTDFYACVSTVKLVADIYEKKTWWGLQKTSRHNFSAQVDTMKLACSQNFQPGPRPPM
ncbi:hypothetical protein RSOL_352250 [Rhizoctonia solani AG-3 Rhs1AP]|uniref:Delta-endotoxin CytB n=1 Tax=Rhizoctonia solani AG-3 Rhs1AP TaxID=1086054 RepID=X8JBA3_9AGAM|nr:hypothetical protein RSOL_352250 [Rhizoctonia solani AG-3 Rhs1AP]